MKYISLGACLVDIAVAAYYFRCGFHIFGAIFVWAAIMWGIVFMGVRR